VLNARLRALQEAACGVDCSVSLSGWTNWKAGGRYLPVGTDRNHQTLIHNGTDLDPGPPKYIRQCDRYLCIYIYIYILVCVCVCMYVCMGVETVTS
jgi:hypothetical protein